MNFFRNVEYVSVYFLLLEIFSFLPNPTLKNYKEWSPLLTWPMFFD